MLRFARMKPALTRALIKLTLPLSTRWVKRQERNILNAGLRLSPELLAVARRLGVQFPERVRVLTVPEVPPLSAPVRFLGRRLGLVSAHTRGMSLRYGILVHSDCWGDDGLIAHELVHTLQYERLGGIAPFLKAYLAECLIHPGYPFGPLEQEAQTVGQALPPRRP
jgi:hypothetical protein